MDWRPTRVTPVGLRRQPHLRRRPAAPAMALLAAFLWGCGATTRAADPGPPIPASPSVSAVQPPNTQAAIPVDQVALRATEVATLLRNFTAALTPGHEIEAIRRALPSFSASTARAMDATTGLLLDQPSLEALQALDQSWHQRQVQSTAWLQVLTERAGKLQDALNQLQELDERWTRTRDSAHAATAPETVLQQIGATLSAVEAAQPLIRQQRDDALELQAEVAAEVVRCETVRTRLARLQRGAVGGIAANDGRPIWRRDVWRQALDTLPARASQIAASYWENIVVYLGDPSKHMPLHLGVFLLVLGALLAARRQVAEWAAAGQDVSRVTAVFNHPLAAASLLALMAATAILSPAPFAVKQLLNALALAPMIVIARPVVKPAMVPVLYVLGLLFALDTVRHAFGGVPTLVDQAIVFVESLTGVAVLAWLLARSRRLGVSGTEADSSGRTLRRFLAGLVIVVLAIGLLASATGYLRLARLTAPSVLVGGAGALWLYAVVEVGTAVMAYALRVWPLRRLRMVQNHRALLEARAHRLFVWMAIGAWLFRYLSYLGLWEPSLAFVSELLTARFGLGSFSTSLGDVLAFLLTLVVAYLFSSFIRFILEEDIYPNVGIQKGISYAASSLLHYTVMALAFLAALGVLGVTLTQVTVLAGALGVGIGFGLQSVVNNFVSGLILLFERPVHVGDAVQVGSLQGWVRRIGIRASVMRTFQGAEVIIPNAQLVTEQVTNWTLSDQQRRLDLPVGVSYGSAPKQVIELLEGVARAHPRVLPDPPPLCLFMGYGDSSINFELRAWTDYANTFQVQSDLTVAVYDAVHAAGMSFPFPQREVRLLNSETRPAAPRDP